MALRSAAVGPGLILGLGLGLVACGGTEPDVPGQGGGASTAGERVPLVGGEIAEGAVAGSPTVLIVTIDTLRADHLGFHGYARETSPFLDSIAEDAVVFDRAYAPIATTLPSHTTMFTGVSPHEHGVLANIADGRTYRRHPDLDTLPELFARAGYVTGAVVSAYPLRPEFGLDSGFEGYLAPKRKQRKARVTTSQALEAMKEQVDDGRPRFMWVHYFDPHGPYLPPQGFGRFHADGEFLAELRARGFVDEAQRPTGQVNILGPGIDSYDGEIAYVDHEIQRLFERAEASGWLDEGAVVAVLADHGEGLNQHGVPGHGLVWEEQLHVPMLVRAPGVAPRRIEAPSTLADFAPTLLHLLDLPGKDAFLAQTTGVDRFAPTVAHGDLRVLGQSSPRQSDAGDLAYSLRAGRWKLHRDAEGAVALYDLEADPYELTDVAAEEPDVVARLVRDLDDMLEAQVGELRTEEAMTGARPARRSMVSWRDISKLVTAPHLKHEWVLYDQEGAYWTSSRADGMRPKHE